MVQINLHLKRELDSMILCYIVQGVLQALYLKLEKIKVQGFYDNNLSFLLELSEKVNHLELVKYFHLIFSFSETSKIKFYQVI